jgi:hypothetical protein
MPTLKKILGLSLKLGDAKTQAAEIWRNIWSHAKLEIFLQSLSNFLWACQVVEIQTQLNPGAVVWTYGDV